MQMLKSMMTVMAVMVIMWAMSSTIKMEKSNKEKTTPFECGFDASHNMRMPFSLRFFILTVVFLIFDIEIAAMLPLPMAVTGEYFNLLVWNTFLFLILSVGLVLEWKQGAMKWMWKCI